MCGGIFKGYLGVFCFGYFFLVLWVDMDFTVEVFVDIDFVVFVNEFSLSFFVVF